MIETDLGFYRRVDKGVEGKKGETSTKRCVDSIRKTILQSV